MADDIDEVDANQDPIIEDGDGMVWTTMKELMQKQKAWRESLLVTKSRVWCLGVRWDLVLSL